MKSYVESLAQAMRQSGAANLCRRDFELRIGRRLSKLERRAFCMAQDSTSQKNGVKASHQARQDAIKLQGAVKGARLPKSLRVDTQTPTQAKSPVKRAFSENSKNEGIGEQAARFAHLPKSRIKRGKNGKLEKVATYTYPKQAETARKRIVQPMPQGKLEEWDTKR